MRPGCILGAMQNGVWWVKRLDSPRRPPRQKTAPATANVLKRYLLAPLAAPLLDDRHLLSFAGEHRRVTTIFFNLLGVSTLLESKGEATALAQTDAYIRM